MDSREGDEAAEWEGRGEEVGYDAGVVDEVSVGDDIIGNGGVLPAITSPSAA